MSESPNLPQGTDRLPASREKGTATENQGAGNPSDAIRSLAENIGRSAGVDGQDRKHIVWPARRSITVKTPDGETVQEIDLSGKTIEDYVRFVEKEVEDLDVVWHGWVLRKTELTLEQRLGIDQAGCEYFYRSVRDVVVVQNDDGETVKEIALGDKSLGKFVDYAEKRVNELEMEWDDWVQTQYNP